MRLALSALVALSTLALPAAAHADTVDDFSMTGTDLTLTFSLPSNPTPDGKMHGLYFYLGDVTFVENGVTMTADDIYFYTHRDGGGFDIDDANGNIIDDLSFYGKKLFTGHVGDPTFKIGDFTLNRDCNAVSDAASEVDSSPCGAYALSITSGTPSGVTPEPASLLLLGTGALGAVGALRRRFAR